MHIDRSLTDPVAATHGFQSTALHQLKTSQGLPCRPTTQPPGNPPQLHASHPPDSSDVIRMYSTSAFDEHNQEHNWPTQTGVLADSGGPWARGVVAELPIRDVTIAMSNSATAVIPTSSACLASPRCRDLHTTSSTRQRNGQEDT